MHLEVFNFCFCFSDSTYHSSKIILKIVFVDGDEMCIRDRHEGDILIHKAAKKAFDAFGLKKLPTVRSLNEEFARLLAEKKAAYAEYHLSLIHI